MQREKFFLWARYSFIIRKKALHNRNLDKKQNVALILNMSEIIHDKTLMRFVLTFVEQNIGKISPIIVAWAYTSKSS